MSVMEGLTLNLVLERRLKQTRIKDPGALSYEHPGFIRGLLTTCNKIFLGHSTYT